MFTAYVLENQIGNRYTGYTSDLQDRLRTHNDIDQNRARFHKTTYKKGPWRVIFSKNFNIRAEAMNFERYLKTGKGREWLERARLGG